MTEIMTELLPVIKEAIIAGKVVGVWWIIGAYGLYFLQTLVKYFLIFKIVEAVVNLLEHGFEVTKDD